MTADCRLEERNDDDLGSWRRRRPSRHPGTAGPRCPLKPPAEFDGVASSRWPAMVLWRMSLTWVISRYEDIRAALTDPRLTAKTLPDALKLRAPMTTCRWCSHGSTIPEHNRLRRMMTRDFTFRRAEAMRPQIQKLVDGFLDDMVETGPPADLVRDFALPVPSLVICAAARRALRRRTSSSSTTARTDSIRGRPTRRRWGDGRHVRLHVRAGRNARNANPVTT